MKKKLLATALLAGLLVSADDRPNVIIILADDWGHADLGIHGVLDDIKTPNLDRLAREGVLFSDGYITAPQCAPSRAGLITGRYQQRFGFDSIVAGPLPLEETTIADRLSKAGYVTGHVGKWHLEPNSSNLGWAMTHHPEIVENNRIVRLGFELLEPYYPHKRGFQEFFSRRLSPYFINFDLNGDDVSPPENNPMEGFRVDIHTEAALAFVERNKENPFFLYLAYFAPHVPLEAPQKYLDRFPGDMPERRRYGLAMMSAVDDGIGRLMDKLTADGLREKTLIFFASDNGAPIGAHWGKMMDDVKPVTKNGPGWDGSRNDPFLGEKGMLSDGGVRVPFIASWPGTVPGGQVYSEPVITLDMTATANAVAGLPQDPQLDGVNLIPFLTGEKAGAPHDALFWKFWNQAAVRVGDWKFIQAGGDRQLLFNLRDDKEETKNLIAEYPETAEMLHSRLSDWADQMIPSGLPSKEGNDQEILWFEHYFDKQKAPEPELPSKTETSSGLLFEDSFDRRDTGVVSDGEKIGRDYVITSRNEDHGALQIRGRAITGGGKGNLSDTILSYRGFELNPAGFTVSADLKLTKSAARSIGVAFNIQDGRNFYKVRILEGTVQIRRSEEGAESVIFDDRDVPGVRLDTDYQLSVSSLEPYVFSVALTEKDSGNVIWERRQEDKSRCFSGGYGGLVLSVNHADPRLDNLKILTVQ